MKQNLLYQIVRILGQPPSITLFCHTYEQALLCLENRKDYPAIVILHPASNGSDKAEFFFTRLLEKNIRECWIYSADEPSWSIERASRFYKKPLSLPLLLRELEHGIHRHEVDNNPLKKRLSRIEKNLPFPVAYWSMGKHLIEDPYSPSYLNKTWVDEVGKKIEGALARQIRMVSTKMLGDMDKRNTPAIIRKQIINEELYNIIFSLVPDNEQLWLRVGLSPSSPYDGKKDLGEYLQIMVQTLAEDYGISRMRLYSTQSITLKGEQHYMLVPLVSFGGGHKEESDDNNDHTAIEVEKQGLYGWLTKPFLYKHAIGQSIFDSKNGELIIPKEIVGERHCKNIEYGEPQSRYLKLIFDQYQPDQRTPVALLVLDKRVDHIKIARKGRVDLSILPHMKHIDIFERTAIGAGAGHNSDITSNDIERMSETLNSFCSGIARRLHIRFEGTLSSLHKKISDAFSDAVDEQDFDQDTAQKITGYLLRKIPYLWAEIRPPLLLPDEMFDSLGLEKGLPSGGTHSLENIYVAIFHHDRWHLLVGHGDYVSGIRKSWKPDILFEDVVNNLESTKKEGGVAQPVIDHDFYQTRKQEYIARRISQMNANAQKSIKQIKSWLGIPIHLTGNVQAVLVIQSKQENYFTDPRIKHLEKLARRAISLINWCYFEKEVEKYKRSLRHEILTPLGALPPEVNKMPQITLLRGFIDTLSPTYTRQTGTCSLQKSFNLFEHLNEVYDNIFQWPDIVPSGTFNLPQTVIDQVLYNFLNNAGRYATYNTSVNILTLPINNGVRIEISNYTNEKIRNTDLLFESRFRGKNTGVYSGSGLGLNVVRKFSEFYGFEANILFNEEEKILTAYIEIKR